MSPAHGPRDPRCPLSPGVFSPEGDCAGELGELVEAVSGRRASGGAASSRQAGPTLSQFRLGRLEQRHRGIGETPDQAATDSDLSKTAGPSKVRGSSSCPQCQAGKALCVWCVCDAGGN